MRDGRYPYYLCDLCMCTYAYYLSVHIHLHTCIHRAEEEKMKQVAAGLLEAKEMVYDAEGNYLPPSEDAQGMDGWMDG